MMNKYYVYIHFNKQNDKPFYVGKGTRNRDISIFGRNKYWKNYTNKYGYYVERVEEDLEPNEASDLEIYWISQLKSWGFKLVNMTNGGDGCYGRKDSEETKLKKSKSLKGHKVSIETREKISIKHIGKKGPTITDDGKKRISEANKGIKRTDEQKQHLSNIKTSPLKNEIMDMLLNKNMSIDEVSAHFNKTRKSIMCYYYKYRKENNI